MIGDEHPTSTVSFSSLRQILGGGTSAKLSDTILEQGTCQESPVSQVKGHPLVISHLRGKSRQMGKVRALRVAAAIDKNALLSNGSNHTLQPRSASIAHFDPFRRALRPQIRGEHHGGT